MTTFERGLLMGNYKKLLKDNKEISGIRDLFASYVSNILIEENKEIFGKEDLSGFEGYFETLKPYHQILQDKGINCSIEMTEIFILGQSVEEFREFMENLYVRSLIKSGKIENIKLFFGRNGIIKTREDLFYLMNNDNWSTVKYFIFNCRIALLDKIFKKYKVHNLSDFEENIDLILQNFDIENDDNLIIGKYTPKNIDFIAFAQKYKPQIDLDNSYLKGNGISRPEQEGAFSLIDLQTGAHIIGEQEKGRKYVIGEQTFFDVNKKEKRDDITLEVQLAINRLFAPIFPMTRLLKLINGETNYVSVDVEENNNGIEISKLDDVIPEEISKFFIMIYQFLCLDYDRNDRKNLGSGFTIYDFDYFFINIKRNLFFFDGIFDNTSLFEEMGEILYTLKSYLISEVDILIPYYERQGKEDVVKIFKKLRTRLDMLNFSNLIYFNEQVNPEVEEFARKVDSENYV